MSRPPRAPSRIDFVASFLAGAGIVLLQAACSSQEAGGPLGLVIAAETRPALFVSDELPLLPDLLRRVASEEGEGGNLPASDLEGWRARWEASWNSSRFEEGARLRTALYREIAPALAEAFDPPTVEAELDEIQASVRAVRDASLERFPAHYRETVDEASTFAAEVRRGLRGGEVQPGAVEALLEAADRLRWIAPRGVATDLLGRAEAAWETEEEARAPAEEEDGSASVDEEADRIERLIRGGRSALEEGEFELAIRRAYYACRLLGVELP